MKIKLLVFIIGFVLLLAPYVFSGNQIPYIEEWKNTENLNKAELQEKYQALFDFTKPYIIREGIKKLILPAGVPDIYGKELDISFDPKRADESITILKQYDNNKLNKEQMDAFIRIGMRTSCEYCCRVRTLVKPMSKDGARSCGCAHSHAMRGLIKYLLVNHSDKYTEDEILAETNRWKVSFFPKQSIRKVIASGELSGTIDTSVLQEMPNMVGGC
jgi:hypothetical protein